MVPIYLPIYSNLFYVYPYVIAGAGIGMGGKEAETNTEIWKKHGRIGMADGRGTGWNSYAISLWSSWIAGSFPLVRWFFQRTFNLRGFPSYISWSEAIQLKLHQENSECRVARWPWVYVPCVDGPEKAVRFLFGSHEVVGDGWCYSHHPHFIPEQFGE